MISRRNMMIAAGAAVAAPHSALLALGKPSPKLPKFGSFKKKCGIDAGFKETRMPLSTRDCECHHLDMLVYPGRGVDVHYDFIEYAGYWSGTTFWKNSFTVWLGGNVDFEGVNVRFSGGRLRYAWRIRGGDGKEVAVGRVCLS